MKKLLLGLILILALGMVSAQPSLQPPHQYSGSVTVDGQPAQDGLLVTAKIDGNDVAATTTQNGGYGLDGKFYVSDPTGTNTGKTVTFSVQNVDTGETSVFSNDPSARSSVDLTVSLGSSGSTTTSTTIAAGGAGGGGGGGGSAAFFDNSEDREELADDSSCVPDWICSDWLTCTSGKQNRVCVDSNRCGVPASDEEQDCDDSVESMGIQENVPFAEGGQIDLLDGEAKKKSFFSSIGLGGTGSWLIVLLVFGIIGAGLFVYMRKKE